MVKSKRRVTLNVDEDFFNMFENARKEEQTKIAKELGKINLNLGQVKFSKILVQKNFKFQIPRKRKSKRSKR